jgi:hypothetical protein
MRSDHSESLEPILQDAEEQLGRRLREACEAEAGGIENKTAAEIREIEDALLSAAVAAEHTLALRRQVVQRADQAPEPAAEAAAAAAAADTALDRGPAPEAQPVVEGGRHVAGVREFADSEGHLWRAWPVTPGVARSASKTRYLGEFQQGWICFESLDSATRRRLPCTRARWEETDDAGLERLLGEAIAAPVRKHHSH